MKLLKKIITILVVLLLCTALQVYAGTTEAKLTASSNNVKVGETVTITLSGYRGNGVEGFDAILKYDKTKLKLTNETEIAAEGYTSLSGIDQLTGNFKLSLAYESEGNSPAQANIAQLKFEVLSGAKANDILNIKLTDAVLVDPDVNGTQLEDIEINLKVVEEPKKPENNNTTGNNNTSENNNNVPDYPYAGNGNYIFGIVLLVTIIAGVIFVKINKYKDIK